MKSDGWITVCGTDVVVILLKRVRDGSQTVCGTGVVVILVKRMRDELFSVWDRRCGDTGEMNDG